MILSLLGVIGLTGLIANPSMNNVEVGGSYYQETTADNTILHYGISGHYLADFLDISDYTDGSICYWFDSNRALHSEWAQDARDFDFSDIQYKNNYGITIISYSGHYVSNTYYLTSLVINETYYSVNYPNYNFYLKYKFFPYTTEYMNKVTYVYYYCEYPHVAERVNFNNQNPSAFYNNLHFAEDYNEALPFCIPSLASPNNFGWSTQSYTVFNFNDMPIGVYDEDGFYIEFNYFSSLSAEDLDGSAYNSGYQDGYNTGRQQGFSEGLTYGGEQSAVALSIFTGIINIALVPINFFLSCLNFEVFGINIGAFVSALLTVAIIVIIARTIFNGGNKSD